MSNQIKAIETLYAGCRFRSRLEARWAVFFNKLRIRWTYESEGYEYEDSKYLPDFYLPEIKTYAEVKGGDEALAKDLDKIREFSKRKPVGPVVILGDVHDGYGALSAPAHSAFLNGCNGTSIVVKANSFHFAFLVTAFPPTTITRRLAGLTSWGEILDAYVAARSARFEFGECG